IVLEDSRGPYWLASNYDPDYCYLLNSLRICLALPPRHIDHPGTTVQVLGAGSLLAVHALYGHGDLTQDVLKDPEAYLEAIHITLLGLCAVALAFAGLVTLRTTKNLFLALVVQWAPWLSTSNLAATTSVSPEPLLLALATLVAAAVVALVFGE